MVMVRQIQGVKRERRKTIQVNGKPVTTEYAIKAGPPLTASGLEDIGWTERVQRKSVSAWKPHRDSATFQPATFSDHGQAVREIVLDWISSLNPGDRTEEAARLLADETPAGAAPEPESPAPAPQLPETELIKVGPEHVTEAPYGGSPPAVKPRALKTGRKSRATRAAERAEQDAAKLAARQAQEASERGREEEQAGDSAAGQPTDAAGGPAAAVLAPPDPVEEGLRQVAQASPVGRGQIVHGQHDDRVQVPGFGQDDQVRAIEQDDGEWAAGYPEGRPAELANPFDPPADSPWADSFSPPSGFIR
jgi:hypothetical protein